MEKLRLWILGDELDHLHRLKREVVDGARSIFLKGLVQTGEGNLSMRIPGSEEMLITPTFNRYNDMMEDDVVHLTFDGNRLEGSRDPSSEYRLHAAVYLHRSRASCVIHTHSPYATMMAVVRKGIPILLEEMVIFLGGGVGVSEFGLAHSDDFGAKALEAMGSNNAALLANHGVLCCGRTLEHALKISELVEKMARVYWGAYQIGDPMTITKEACKRFRHAFEADFDTR